jgi:hypothetical protein
MAKMTGSRAGGGEGGNSKIRFIMLEADLNGGDLTQITQAISNALRPATSLPPMRVIAPPMSGPVVNGAPPNGANADETDADVETPIEAVNDGAAMTPKSQRKRSYREPKIIDGLDVTGNSGTTWVQFATAKAPKSKAKRFLTAMTWFKNHGGKAAIGIDEVYTAFRTPGVDWPYAFPDYDSVFRGLVAQDVASRTDTGLYAINVVGEGKVDKRTDD